MNQLSEIFQILSPEERKQALSLLGFMLAGALLETFSLGMIIPALNLIGNESAATRVWQENLLRTAHLTAHQIVILGIVCLLLVYLIKTLFLIFLTWKQNKFVFGVRSALSERLFRKYLQMPWSYYLKTNSAHLINILTNETNQFGSYALQPILTLITELMVVSAIFVFLIIVEPVAAISIVCILALILVAIYGMTRNRLLRWGKARQLHEGLRIQQVQQGIGGIKEIKILGRERDFITNYEAHNRLCSQIVQKQNTVQQTPRLMLEFIVIAIIFMLILTSISQGKTLVSTVATLALFGGAAFRLMPSATRLIGALQSLRYANSVLSLLKQETLNLDITHSGYTENTGNLSFKNEIEFSDVVFTYPNTDLPTINHITLKIPKGSCIGFIGESGSGKSTLVDIFLGLLKPESGKISVDDIDINLNLKSWQQSIGYVPQTIFLSDDTLRRNIAFGIPDEDINESQITQALAMAQLSNFVSLLPDGLDTFVGERGVRLSGGQKQRIGIARALYHNPAILVLDEATSALDSSTETEVMNAVNELIGTKTLIIIAHRLSTLAMCDWLYWIDKGYIKDQGKFETIMAKLPSRNLSAD